MAASSTSSFSRSKTGFGSEVASVGPQGAGYLGGITNPSLMDVNLASGNFSKNATAIP